MSKLLDKLFLKKAENINSDIKEANKILEKSKIELNEINDKASLLLSELRNLISSHAFLAKEEGYNEAHGLFSDAEDYRKRLKEKSIEIDEIIAEIKIIMNKQTINENKIGETNVK